MIPSSPSPSADPEVLIQSGIQLPAQPRVLQELHELGSAGEPSVRSLAEHVTRDPGVTAALYRVARSPMYRRRVPPQSVEQVVLLLGTRFAMSCVQAFAMKANSTLDPPLLERFWARSESVAELAALVADGLPGRVRVARDQAYLAGMLHDCGVPILMERFPRYCVASGLDAQARKWVDVDAEDRAFHCDHTVVGYLLAKHWGLPDYVAQVIHHHHDKTLWLLESEARLVRCVQLAMRLYTRNAGLEDGASAEAWRRDLSQGLGLGMEELIDFEDFVLESYHNDVSG